MNSEVVISVENLTKTYDFGQQSYGSIKKDFARLWARIFGKDDPNTLLHQDKQGPFHALDDVSFTVNRGEVLGILGRNGAGKSTLLKILSRITAPTTGRVRIRGNVSSLLEIGTGFHPDLSGRENIYLNGAIHGLSRAEIRAKFNTIADFSEIGDFLDVPVKRYSSGMFVRLAFSVASHLEPEILILDEVLAVGDADFQKKCLLKIDEIWKTQSTILFVSHDIEMVKKLCSRAIYLEHGKLIADGEVGSIFNRMQQKTE